MAHPIEIILARQLAGYLSTPFFLVDPEGNLLFYNEPAEAVLGLRFQETGAMPAARWAAIFTPLEEAGRPLPPAELPLIATLGTRRPGYKRFRIQGLDGQLRSIEVVSVPLVGLRGDLLGAAALFWEVPA